ncbi:hypothetical protein JCM11491_000852 [Sporobolomyces phaffii]
MIQPISLVHLADAPDQRAYLQTLLKQIVGSRPRKEALLRAGGIDYLATLLTPHDPTRDLSTEAAAVLAAVSLPTLESVSVLASPTANVYERIVEAFVTVSNDYSSLNDTSALYQKRLDVHLRCLKTLFIDLVSAERPHGNYSTASIRKGGINVKGKEKEDDVEMAPVKDISANVEDLRDKLTGLIYDLAQDRDSISPRPGPSSFSSSPSANRLSPVLGSLLDLLDDASRPDHAGSRLSGISQRTRIADHICSLLSRTMRGFRERQAIAAGGKGKETLAALKRLVETGSEKVQEGALRTLTAIIRDSHVALLSLLELGGVGSTADRLQPFIALAQSPTPSIRLAAVTFCAAASKLQPSSSIIALDPAILLSLIEKEPSLRGSAAHAFAFLVTKDSEAQKRAAAANCFEIFRRVLDSIPTLADIQRSGLPLEDDVKTREGILGSLSYLTADSETNRRLLLDAKLLSHVLESLLYPVVAVRAAACQVLRALSRSVNVLRTDLVEAHAESALIQLLRADEDAGVQTTATAVFANLLLEFSPMRKILIDAGCIPRLCCLALNGQQSDLQLNALWAIKNAVYQSSRAFKQSLLRDLTWQDLATLSRSTRNPPIAEEALGIIRNITCVTHNEVLDALSDFGEDELLELLQSHLVGGSAFETTIQALYCLNNIATAGESAQLAIASRTTILRCLLAYLDHPAASVRTASLWVIHNLVYRRGSPSISPRLRRPHEITEKLRVLGFDAKLRLLERDPELDVRERVRDIQEAMQ